MGEEEGESLLSWFVWYAHAAAWTSGLALLSFCLTATVVFAVLKIIARRVRQANAKSGELTVSACTVRSLVLNVHITSCRS
jgi:hypothetical protein